MVNISGKLIYLDTNIFIYHFSKHALFGEKVRSIFEKLVLGEAKAITSVLTLTELLSLDMREKDVENLKNHFLSTPNLKIIEFDQEISVLAAKIRRKYLYKTPDSIALATAQISKSDMFITNDLRLRSIPGCKVVKL